MLEESQWQLFLKGDENALGYFFRKYHSDLFHYGMKLSGNEDIVKDSIQEMFLKLWKNRANLSQVKMAKYYLLKVLRRHIQSNLALQEKFTGLDDPLQNLPVEFSAEDFVMENEVEKETCKKVLEALNQLTPRQRESIYLRFFENLDFSTISQVMDMNVQSVRNSIHKGLQSMRERMALETFLILIGYKLSM